MIESLPLTRPVMLGVRRSRDCRSRRSKGHTIMISTLPTSLRQATLPQIMKRSLSHLPKHKREELKEIVSIITENSGVEMLILFGSYARGDWVEDTYTEGHITYEYKSDYDILVIVRDRHYARRINPWR